MATKTKQKTWKIETETATIREVLDWLPVEISGLADEMRNWADEMKDTNLESTAKYEEVSDTADTLENAVSNLEDEIAYSYPRRYGKVPMSREVQLRRLINMGRALENYLRNQGIASDDLTAILDDLETVDFPEMY